MKELYIVGAGGFGREVYGWLKDTSIPSGWEFSGFLDDNSNALEDFNYDKGVVAAISDFRVKPSQLFVCGIGNVQTKIRLCQPLLNQSAQFMTIVHPSTVVGKNVHLGQGVILCPGVILTCDIEVGDMVMINCRSSIGHDVSIGDWSTVSANCDLTGHTKLGREVFLGSGARIIPDKSVGDNAVIGAGSVVIRSVPAGQKVFGNPARAFA